MCRCVWRVCCIFCVCVLCVLCVWCVCVWCVHVCARVCVGGSAKALLWVPSAVLRRFRGDFAVSGVRGAVPQRPLAGRARSVPVSAPWEAGMALPAGMNCWRAGPTLPSPKQHRHSSEKRVGSPRAQPKAALSAASQHNFTVNTGTTRSQHTPLPHTASAAVQVPELLVGGQKSVQHRFLSS